LKILYFTSRFPYPLEKGDKLRAYYQIAALAAHHEVHLVSITDEDQDKKDLEKLRAITSSIHFIRIAPMERYISLIKALTSGIPFQIAWFYSEKAHAFIKKIALDIAPDHLFCQLPRMAEYVADLPYPKTLDYMDSFGVGMNRRAAVAKGWSSWIYKNEAIRMIRYESVIAKKFDHLTIISQQDKDQFKFPEATNINVIQNGISAAFFDFNRRSQPEFDIVFVGNMSYLPNIEAAEYLIRQILPALPSSLKVLLAGANPAPRIKRLESSQVTITGWIEDIRTAYANGRVFVAPMWSGTGQQNKILEAMAMGIPCVTTESVNNAIGATPETEILLGEDTASFVAAIERLLHNKELYQTISSNSTKFVKQNFDWEQNGRVLSSIFAQNKK